MAYISAAEFLKRYDARIVGDLTGDAGARISSTGLLTDANLAATLDDAAGWIESAALVGNRYLASDLSGLSGNSAAFIKRLNADLAFSFLRQRRGFDTEQFPAVQESFAILDRLRLGERIFNVEDVKAKHNPTSNVISVVDIFNQNLVRDFAHRYYTARRFTTSQ